MIGDLIQVYKGFFEPKINMHCIRIKHKLHPYIRHEEIGGA